MPLISKHELSFMLRSMNVSSYRVKPMAARADEISQRSGPGIWLVALAKLAHSWLMAGGLADLSWIAGAGSQRIARVGTITGALVNEDRAGMA